jgi:hypothetical protein
MLAFFFWVVAMATAPATEQPIPENKQESTSSFQDGQHAANNCELHIWTAASMSSLGEGALLNHVEGQALRNAKVPLPALLEPSQQVQLLKSLDVPTTIGHADYTAIFHSEAAPRRMIGVPHFRRTTSTSSCYAEMSLDKIFYHYSPLMSAELRTLVTFDEFGENTEARSSFSSWGTAPLSAFPPKTIEGRDAAMNDLSSAFLGTVKAFASHMIEGSMKAPKSKSHPQPATQGKEEKYK